MCKYGIFVAKIYKYAPIDSFQGFSGSLDSAGNCAALASTELCQLVFYSLGRALTRAAHPAGQDMSIIKNLERHFTFVFLNIVHIILKFCPRKCFRYQIIDVETQPRLSDWVTDIPGDYLFQFQTIFQHLKITHALL